MDDKIITVNLRALAEDSALQAGELLRRMWSGPRKIRSKGYRDWVTDADLASQDLITGMIRQQFPGHGFITEEDDPSLSSEGDVVWIIDPLDGTSNYSRQHPIFCVSIAAAARYADGDAQVVAGTVYDPMRDELFSAANGLGSTLNGREIVVSKTESLGTAIVGLDWSRRRSQRRAILDAVERIGQQAHTIRAIGSAALALAWVAAGRLDVYFNIGAGAWDVAASSVLIRESGGFVSNHRGDSWSLEDSTCIASNRLLHSEFERLSGLGEWRADNTP